MDRVLTYRRAGWLAGAFGVLVLLWSGTAVSSQSSAATGVPTFLQPEHCYRFTFPIAGATNWKVLEVNDAGWIRAEVDAGAASAKREAAWVNTAQIITVRQARCSGE